MVGIGGCLKYPDAGDDTGGSGPVDATLGSLRGTVTDAAGAPVAGAFLTTTPRGYEATSGADGSFLIELLPPGSYQVVAAATGRAAATSAEVEVQAGAEAQVDLVLSAGPAGGTLRVRLRGPDDQPLVGASVSTSTGASGVTDADGLLELTGVAGDAVLVTLGADDDTWPVVVQDLSISAAGGEQLAFQLSGRPPEGATYMGALVCAVCHADVASAHDDTLHADALSTGLSGEVLDRFAAGEELALGLATARLAVDDDSPTVTLVDAAGATQVHAVAGLIGSDRSRAVPWTEEGEQAWPLPLAFIAAEEDREEGYPDGQARFTAYELDRWFDEAGRFVERDPATSAEAGCFPCHATGYLLATRSDGGVDMTAATGAGRWQTTGVQCESCHGPGSAHYAAGTDAAFTITSPELLPADRANEVCGQCHARTVASGTGLPYPWSDAGGFQPGMVLADFAASDASTWPSGAAAASRQQLDELRTSPHGDGAPLSMTCLDCHGPHGLGDDGQAWPHQGRSNPDDNSLCLGCHLDRSFAGDEGLVEDHVAHARFDPTSDHRTGRCATCHMPATAAAVGFSERSGAGDVSSHLFTVRSPQETLDFFDALGVDTLPVGEFPIHSCAECHDYGQWVWESLWDSTFPGPAGAPTERETHADYQDAYVEKYE